MIVAKCIHDGQYRPYGDTFQVWELKTDGESKEEVLRYIRENVHKADIPNSREWSANIRYGGKRYHDPLYYYRGCYSMKKIDGGYRYTVKEPFYD